MIFWIIFIPSLITVLGFGHYTIHKLVMKSIITDVDHKIKTNSEDWKLFRETHKKPKKKIGR